MLKLCDLNMEFSSMDDALLLAILPFCPALSSLDLWRCKGVTDRSALAITKHCPDLKVLCLAFTAVGDAGVRAVAQSLTKLVRFSMGNMLSRDVVITDETLAIVVQQLPLLENLNLGNCVHLSMAAVTTLIPRHCPGLKVLSLGALRKTTDDDLMLLVDALPRLQRLAIPLSNHITDRSILHVAERCTQLRSILIPFAKAAKLNRDRVIPAFPAKVKIAETGQDWV
jgi:hypothetical protein